MLLNPEQQCGPGVEKELQEVVVLDMGDLLLDDAAEREE